MIDEPTFDMLWMQRLTGATEILRRNIPASEAMQELMLEERHDHGMGSTVFLRPTADDPARLSAAAEAERRALLIVAYEAYELSQHVAEFDTIVDPFPIEQLDQALYYAFGTRDFLEVGERIAAALGGYEAALAARREAQQGGEG